MRLGLALVVCLFLAMPASAQSVLRVVPHADLRTLDPVAVSVVITRMHGLMIYETLFAWDQSLTPQPQMVDTWSVSDDQLTWRFTLRDGLAFHDGKPVTTRNVAASLRRWMSRDTVGSRLGDSLASLDIAYAQVACKDFHAPSVVQIDAAVAAIRAFVADERRVYLHCRAGLQRSVTIAACYLVASDVARWNARSALDEVCAKRRRACPMRDQIDALLTYDRYVRALRP